MNPPASPADSLSDAQRPVSIHEPSMFAYATDMEGMGAGVHVGIHVHGCVGYSSLNVICLGCYTKAASQILGKADTQLVIFL